VLRDTFALDASGMAPWEGRVLSRGDGRLTVVRAEDLGGPTFHMMTPVAASAELRRALQTLPEGNADAYAAACLAGALPRYGFEYDEKTIPLETGLLREISFDKGCYLGQEVIARLYHQKRVKRRLVRLRFEGTDLPVRGAVVEAAGEPVGKITGAAVWEGEALAFASVDAGAVLDGAALTVRGEDGAARPATLREGEST
jgi:folate-binding protein YgfZ